MAKIPNLNEKIKLYNFKNEYLKFNDSVAYHEINLEDFITMIFERNGEMPFQEKGKDFTDGRYNALAVEIGTTKKTIIEENGEKREIDSIYHHIITNDLEQLDEIRNKKFVVMSPITYIGRNRNSNNARYCYGLAFDIDGINEKKMIDLLHQMDTNWIPTANIIVNSGNGVHLYYLFKEPIALFNNVKPLLKTLKYKLTNVLWNSYTSILKDKQYQGIFQGFRMPETLTKFSKEVKAFTTDHEYYTVEQLNGYIKDPKERLTDEEVKIAQQSLYSTKKVGLKKAKELYPDWYERRIVKGESRKAWNIKQDLYEWWLRKCYSDEIKEGHRYFTLLALSMYALKCNIPYEQLKKDAFALFEPMEELTKSDDNHFTYADIEDGLKAYQENYRTFPRKDIEKITGVSIPPNKRNGRSRELHLKGARAVQEVFNPNWRNKDGRPKGSGTKEKIVREWREQNPNGRKIDCHKELGLSRVTINKYWE